MDNRRKKQQGSVAVLAVVAMLFLGMIIAGLLPMLTMRHSTSNADRDTLAARYAAEAGLKRACVALATHSTDWDWLSSDSIIQNIPLRDGSSATYRVRIAGIAPTLSPVPGQRPNPGQYTITSTGMVNGLYQQVVGGPNEVGGGWIEILQDGRVQFRGDNHSYGIVDHNPPYSDPSNPVDPPPGEGNAVFPGPVNDPAYVHATQYGVLSGGTLTVYGGNYVNPTYGSDYALATTAGTPGFQWGPAVTTSVTQVLLDMFNAGFFSPTSPRLATFTSQPLSNEYINPGVAGTSWSNVWTTPVFPSGKNRYEVSGDVVFNTHDPLTLASPSQVVIYAHGNITVNTRMQGNFILIADGAITLNGNENDTGQIELYSQGPMVVDHRIGVRNGSSAYGVFMTRSTLTVHGNYYNKAFMFGRTSVTLDGGGTLNGAVYSLGNITITSNTNFTYDPSVIP